MGMQYAPLFAVTAATKETTMMPRSRTTRFLAYRASALLACAAILGSAACKDELGTSCTAMGCLQGLDISFQRSEPGSYVVDLDIDGKKVRCSATIPLPAEATACDDDDVFFIQSGSALSPDRQSVGGLQIQRTDVKKLSVKLTKDGNLVVEKSFDVTYNETPGPNGPECEPKVCRSNGYRLE
jgi:hypothetical protein